MIGHNDPEATRWITEINRGHEALEEQKIEHMNRCREIRERINQAYDAAKKAGLPIKQLKSAIRVSHATQKLAALVEKLTPEDPDDADAFERLRAIATPGDLFEFATKPKTIGLPGANAEFA